MEKTFTYQFETGSVYLENHYENVCEYDNYDYIVGDEQLKEMIVCILFDTYFEKTNKMFDAKQIYEIKEALKNYTDDNDNWEDLANDFEDELKKCFEDDAFNEYKYGG